MSELSQEQLEQLVNGKPSKANAVFFDKARLNINKSKQEGKRIYETPSIENMRQKRHNDLAKLDSGVKRVVNPHIYHVSLTNSLWELKQNLMKSTETKLTFAKLGVS